MKLHSAVAAATVAFAAFGAASSALASPAVLRALEPTRVLLSPGSVDEYALEIGEAFTGKSASVDLVLPDGVYVAQRSDTQLRDDGFLWTGKIHGYWEVVLTSHQGNLRGLIYTPYVSYEVFSGPDGRLRLAQLDQDQFPGCLDEPLPSAAASAPSAPSLLAPGAHAAAATASDPVIMDVMVVYTPDARIGAGGVSQIEATIQSAVDITNTAYINSQIDARINLVHVQEVAYSDSGNFSSDLTWLRTDTTVANLRDTYGADMVGMIVNGGNACGIGYVQRTVGASFAPFAFQVTARGCAVGNLSFAHEFGHNQGCEHDPANGPSPSSASYPWSFGHFHSGAYRTVMSYSNQCVGGCSRAPYFSNPSVSNVGLPTGIANQRDNHRTINLTASVVADFRPSASAPVEFGTAVTNQANSSTFYPVSFSSSLTSPIVVMGPTSFAGAQPGNIRVNSVTSSGFQFQFDEWDYLDGGHVTESTGWLALGSGAQAIGSLDAEAGSVSATHAWVTVNFSQSFSTAPVVIAQIATYNGSQSATTRVRNVTTSSFQVRVQEEEGNDGTHASETIHFIAIEPGTTDVGGNRIAVGRTGNSITDAFATINFGITVQSPSLVAQMQTFDGSDPADLRHRSLSTTSVEIKVEEEASGDSETGHTTEVVGWIVAGTP